MKPLLSVRVRKWWSNKCGRNAHRLVTGHWAGEIEMLEDIANAAEDVLEHVDKAQEGFVLAKRLDKARKAGLIL